jgi:predicted Zn-dependent protease
MITPHLLAEAAISALSKRGYQGVAIIDAQSQSNLRFANNNLTTNGLSFSVDATVIAMTSITNPSVGISGGAVHNTDQIDALVAEAISGAASNLPAQDSAPLYDTQSPDWASDAAITTMSDFAEISPKLGEALNEARSSKKLLFGFAQQSFSTTYLATTAGARLRHVQPTATLEMTARTPSADASAWWSVGGSHIKTLSPTFGAEELTRRLIWSQRKVEISPGRHEALLPPSAVADLMVYLAWSAGVRDAVDGRSVFSAGKAGHRIGQRLSKLPFTLFSEPKAVGIECAPFEIAHASTDNSSVFDNGAPLNATKWIDAGVLNSLFGSRFTEKETGIPSTPIIDNLILDGEGTKSLDEMVASTSDGLLVTCLWYIREVDPRTLLLTGLTRDGVYAIRNGEIVGAVSNFRFNESPVDLLGRCTEVGESIRTLPREFSDNFTRTKMPSLRIPDYNFSSIAPGI